MSTTHTMHPDIQGHGLADGCPRCDEIAPKPFQYLDEDCLRDLAERTFNRTRSRSMNEDIAMGAVVDVVRFSQKLTRVGFDPLSYEPGFYTITEADVGRPQIYAFGCHWFMQPVMGSVMARDVGKRLYVSDGVMQVESVEQRARRLGPPLSSFIGTAPDLPID